MEDAACRIPKRMWNPEKDIVYVSDHMFYIEDDDMEYIIYGGQLEKISSEDEKYNPFFLSFDKRSLKNYTLESLELLIKENTDLIEIIVDKGQYIRPSFSQYYIYGLPGERYEGYETYIVAMNEKNMRFIEIILFKDTTALTEREKYEIFKYCNYIGP